MDEVTAEFNTEEIRGKAEAVAAKNPSTNWPVLLLALGALVALILASLQLMHEL